MHPIKFKNFIPLVVIGTLICLMFTGFSIKEVKPGKKIEENKNYETPVTPKNSNCFLVISDIHLFAGATQHEANGDTGDSLWLLAKAEIKKIIDERKPSFIIILGDLPRHETATKKDSLSVRQSIVAVIKYFKDSANIPGEIPLIYIPGNNDSWNGDYSAFTLPDSLYNTYGYPLLHVKALPSRHQACIGDNSLMKSLDCFSAYPLGKKGKLRLIVLNTVIFTKSRSFPYSAITTQQDIDATRQLNWMIKELKNAASHHEKVLIAMHVPPGLDGYSGKNMWYSRQIEHDFLQAIITYKKNIIGLLAGHTHMDGIRLFLDSTEQVSSLLISSPGIAVGHGNNPGIKLIEYNPHDFALQNFTTYYMNYWDNCLNKKSDSCGERLTGWNDSFNFRSEFSINGPLSMLQYFQEHPKKEYVEETINKFYSVYGKKQPAGTIDTTIYLKQ